jgi:sulfide:quinone oxidoreductase
MTLPATPLKCAGAPLKMTFMLRDRLRRPARWAPRRSASSRRWAMSSASRWSTTTCSNAGRTLGIDVEFSRKLTAIDIGARRATFVSPEGEKQEMPYDFIHVVPPMRAPDAVKNSDLAWKEGPFAAGGWLEVDKATLQHRRYPNVFGIGDINGTPRGKTAATVKKSAPLVAHNLVEVIAGRQGRREVRRLHLVPADHARRLGDADRVRLRRPAHAQSLPMIEPLQDSFFAWLMKYRMLKPAYMAVLKGRV